MIPKLLADLSLQEMKRLTAIFGQPIYRAKQLYAWVIAGTKYDSMTNLPLDYRQRLAERYIDVAVQIEKTLKSTDGSEKYLYRLVDGETVEGIYLPNRYGNTLCISTQVGCRMGCAFCASGIGGLSRNLSSGELLSQFIVASNAHGQAWGEKRAISNIVMMGSGEPLDNYEYVIAFIRSVSAQEGLKVSPRNISLSTCGLALEIRKLADEGLGVTLSLSLHATTDEARQKVMPIAKRYPLSEVLSAVKYYFEKTGRRVIFEYALIQGVNSSDADIKRLAGLTKGFPCHVNLITLNHVAESGLNGISGKDANAFLKALINMGVSASLRHSYGSDIFGACGQLRRKFVGDLDSKNSPE